MAINLKKGQSVQLSLKHIVVGLGWNPSDSNQEFDLDASAFMLDATHKTPNDNYFVFYNNPESPDKSVCSSGDDRCGGSGNGVDEDDESLDVLLENVNPIINEIVFVVSIYESSIRNQHFGQVKDAYIRIVDKESNKEIVKYQLDEDFSGKTIIEFGRLIKKSGAWSFEALGNAYEKDLEFMLNKYVPANYI